MKKYLSISQIAKYAGLTRRTLIYYDEIDLFKPKMVGENGYRYYTIEQCSDLDVILVLRSLDMSLEDIKQFLINKNPKDAHQELARQEKRLDKKINQLLLAKKSITRYLERYEKLESIDLDKMVIEEKATEFFAVSDTVLDFNDISMATIYSEFYSFIAPEDLFNGYPLGFLTMNSKDYLKNFHANPYQLLVKIDETRLASYDPAYIIEKPAGIYISGFMTNEEASLQAFQVRLETILKEEQIQIEERIWEFLWQDETVASSDSDLLFEVSMRVVS